MEQLTEEQAIAFYESGAWKQMSAHSRAYFQVQQERLCMPFSEFHKAIEEALHRPVYTHEFAFGNTLSAELEGISDAPDFEDILALLPVEKTIVVAM